MIQYRWLLERSSSQRFVDFSSSSSSSPRLHCWAHHHRSDISFFSNRRAGREISYSIVIQFQSVCAQKQASAQIRIQFICMMLVFSRLIDWLNICQVFFSLLLFLFLMLLLFVYLVSPFFCSSSLFSFSHSCYFDCHFFCHTNCTQNKRIWDRSHINWYAMKIFHFCCSNDFSFICFAPAEWVHALQITQKGRRSLEESQLRCWWGANNFFVAAKAFFRG